VAHDSVVTNLFFELNVLCVNVIVCFKCMAEKMLDDRYPSVLTPFATRLARLEQNSRHRVLGYSVIYSTYLHFGTLGPRIGENK
jgi:hypothetical protein